MGLLQGQDVSAQGKSSKDTSRLRWPVKLIEARPARFPMKIPQEGPQALHLQVLLDRAGFSPGIIDGAWGLNAAKAITFFSNPSSKEQLNGDSPPKVTSIDQPTYERLRREARSKPILKRYAVTTKDLAGPFTEIPGNVYKQEKLKCLCYASPLEQFAERFHASQNLLRALNSSVRFDRLAQGTVITVPNVEADGSATPQDTMIVARLVISKKGYWTHALDENGRIIFHFPSTLGAGYDPSPTGDFKVTWVSRDPAFHYQPKLFHEVPDSDPDAHLPVGPNSPVGVVWMSLSKPHYGIHGTSSPETIGYANSHGCVRLTNWDALRLSDLVESGTPVQFR
jgi:lipoprotein-anchoring transpeptidase ErfK/SrfK